MSTVINIAQKETGQGGAITVETLDDATICVGFFREGQAAQSIKLSRDLADKLAQALSAELRGAA